ncbi:MAG: MOFRL family protein, partial [Rectinema sp.]
PKDTERMMFLSSATDGNDGPTDAAGAFASIGILEDARSRGLDPAVFLADNDSYAFFDSVGALLRTGPTNTNVCDIQILLVR